MISVGDQINYNLSSSDEDERIEIDQEHSSIAKRDLSNSALNNIMLSPDVSRNPG